MNKFVARSAPRLIDSDKAGVVAPSVAPANYFDDPDNYEDATEVYDGE